MRFTDVFIRRPVLASVVSLLILLVGVRSMLSLPVRQYPEMKSTVVTVTTAYPGADSELVKGFITTPLEQAVAQADGIDYMTSSSTQGTSTIEVHMVLNYDPNAAVAEIQATVARTRNVLPAAAESPVIDSTTDRATRRAPRSKPQAAAGLRQSPPAGRPATRGTRATAWSGWCRDSCRRM